MNWDSSRWGWIVSLIVVSVGAAWSQQSRIVALEKDMAGKEVQLAAANNQRAREIDQLHDRLNRIENHPCK